MCMCMATTWSGQPYPLFDLMEVPIIGKWKADLRQRFLRWRLDNVSLWGACLMAVDSPRTSADASSSSPMPAVMFSRGTVHQQRLNGPLLCLCCMHAVYQTSPGWNERGRTDRREWRERARGRGDRRSEVFSLFIALRDRQSNTTAAARDPTIQQGDGTPA